MTTITGLGLVLLILMVLVGGKQGWTAFLSLLLNFGFLYFAIILVAFHVPPLFVTVTIGITILAITIFMGEDDLRTTVTAFYASLIVVCLILVLIFIIEHWAMVQGFGTEDSDELEGMSTLIGISYFKVSVTTTILSSLGAIAEAAMAISSGLTEILENHPERTNRQLIHSYKKFKEILFYHTLPPPFLIIVSGTGNVPINGETLPCFMRSINAVYK